MIVEGLNLLTGALLQHSIGSTSCKRQSPPCTIKHPHLRKPIGHSFEPFTTRCEAIIL